ncbi:hypothetical protein, partial [Methylobacterium nonmethylotrophicum]|uniref:hypothetical protein n=1 Tax=Methylobacterium nonmethylotrophicum TaxID=1141884 RepID=UPI001436A151
RLLLSLLLAAALRMVRSDPPSSQAAKPPSRLSDFFTDDICREMSGSDMTAVADVMFEYRLNLYLMPVAGIAIYAATALLAWIGGRTLRRVAGPDLLARREGRD